MAALDGGLVYLNCAASAKNNPKGDQNGLDGPAQRVGSKSAFGGIWLRIGTCVM